MKRIAFVMKPCFEKYYAASMPLSGVFDPVETRLGGTGATAAQLLRQLGAQVELFGRVTDDLERFWQNMLNADLRCRMERVSGSAPVDVVLPPRRMLRVCTGPKYAPSSKEAQFVARNRVAAIAATGPLEDDYVEFWMTAAAARGVPFFWKPGPSATLSQIESAGDVYLQISFDEYASANQRSPAELARHLLACTGAAGVVITAGTDGSYGVLRVKSGVLHAPALRLRAPIREIGAEDAHFAGFVATFLDAPEIIRLERGLSIARLVAARHMARLAPAGWWQLRLFQNRIDYLPPVRVAA